MQSKNQTFQEYFRNLNIIYFAILSSILIIGSILFFMQTTSQTGSPHPWNDILLYIVPALILGGILGSRLIGQNRLRSIRQKSDLKVKLEDYQAVFILRLGLLEAPALIALICFFITDNYLFLAFAGLIIIVFLAYMPAKATIASELELSQSERALIEDPDQIVVEGEQK